MWKFTAVMAVIFVIAAALVGPGWAAEHPTETAGLGVAAVLVAIGLALIVGVFIGVILARRLMGDGASIALKAQQVNDEWDAKKTTAFAGLMREGATIGRQAPGALPMLGQGQAFSLPPLAEFGGRQFEVIDQESEAQ